MFYVGVDGKCVRTWVVGLVKRVMRFKHRRTHNPGKCRIQNIEAELNISPL